MSTAEQQGAVKRDGAESPERQWRFILAAFVCFFAISTAIRPLMEPDEGRYTAVALQMLRSKDWLRPHLHPDQPHYSKPPLLYWAMLPGLKLIGRHEWAARLPNVLAWTIIVATLVRVGGRFFAPWAAGPALIFATSAYPFIAFSVITPDPLLSLWEWLAALGFLFSRYTASTRKARKPLIGAYLALALGFLTKGPPALIPWLAWWLTAVLARERAARQSAMWLPGIALFLAVGTSWYVFMVREEPRLLEYFLKGEIRDRLFSAAHHRNPQWYKPFRMYGIPLTAGFLPWLALLLLKARDIRVPAVREWPNRLLQADPATRFFAIWFFVGLAIFWLAPSRLPLYILPLAIPYSWLMALLLRRFCAAFDSRWLYLWGLLLLMGIFVYSRVKEEPADFAARLGKSHLLDVNEIVFAGTRPLYGLFFYTGIPVERCDLRERTPLPGAPFKTFQTVAEELGQYSIRRLWLAREPDLEALVSELEGRVKIERIGRSGFKNYAFVKTAAPEN